MVNWNYGTEAALFISGLLVVYLVVVVVLIRRQISVVGDDDEEEDEMYKDKGSLPIEKVRNFREFSRTGGGGVKRRSFSRLFLNCLEWANSSRNAKKIFSIFWL